MDSNTFNLDLDPECCPNLDPVPRPYVINFENKILKVVLDKNNFR